MADSSDKEDNMTVGFTIANVSGNSTTKCAVFDGDQSKCDILTIIGVVIGSLSLAACVFILFIQWLYRRYKVCVQRLIMCLTLVSAIGCIVKIMGDKPISHHGLCIFQAMAWQYVSWATLVWVCCITFHLFMNSATESSTEKLEWFYHVAAWFVPFLICLVPLAGQAYGPAGAWCWIIDRWEWRFGMWYCPYTVVVVLLFIVYSFIIYKINVKTRSFQGHYDPQTERRRLLLMEQVTPLRIYPLVYLLCGIFPLIDRIYNAVTGEAIFGLKIMHAISNPLQGALNALVFCLDRDTVHKLHWVQIKLAIQQRWSKTTSHIREYPTDMDVLPEKYEETQADSSAEQMASHI